MNLRQKLAAASALLLLTSNMFPPFPVKAQQENSAWELSLLGEESHSFVNLDNESDETALSSDDPAHTIDSETDLASPSDALREDLTFPDNESDDEPVFEETPEFTASIELDPQGYNVRGTFTEFTSDLILVRPLYSLDGETYEACGLDWDLRWLGSSDEDELRYMANQAFLRPLMEPLKSYLAGTIDRFYVKLSLTTENGEIRETQSAVIERGHARPLPDDITPIAVFAPSMAVNEWRPYPPRRYGRYQMTVNEDASPQDIAAYLPDTLPLTIQLLKQGNAFADCTIDCPVTWKPLSIPELTAGEPVTIPDAAEEIIVSPGTVLNTPMGIYVLNEPLGIDQYGLTDEVRLVLNPVSRDEDPDGRLAAENSRLHMTFPLKPTGATSIRVYTLSPGDTEWTEIPEHSLLEAVNGQPALAGSSLALVIGSDQEPYLSYPVPFLVGLRIEGGVYDGRQLILPWPSSYEVPLHLPKLDGSGGNQGNAGDGNKGDGTEEGQRPYLPQEPSLTAPEESQSQQSPAPEKSQSQQNPALEEPPRTADKSTRYYAPPQSPGQTTGPGLDAPPREDTAPASSAATEKNPPPAEAPDQETVPQKSLPEPSKAEPGANTAARESSKLSGQKDALADAKAQETSPQNSPLPAALAQNLPEENTRLAAPAPLSPSTRTKKPHSHGSLPVLLVPAAAITCAGWPLIKKAVGILRRLLFQKRI